MRRGHRARPPARSPGSSDVRPLPGSDRTPRPAAGDGRGWRRRRGRRLAQSPATQCVAGPGAIPAPFFCTLGSVLRTPILDLFRPAMRLTARAWFGLEFRGVENIPRDGGLIITPNHQTYA